MLAKAEPHNFNQNHRSLRICMLGYRSHPFVGGQGIYIKYLSKALVDAGHQVDVISGPPYPELDPRVRLIEMPGLNLFDHPHPTFALRWRHLFSWADFFEWWSKLTGGFAEPYTFSLRVANYMKKNACNYDIIHDNQCLGSGLVTLQKRGLPVIATIHHPITRDRDLAIAAAPNLKHRLLVRRWYLFLNMQKKVAQSLKHIITVSNQSKQDTAIAFDRPIDTITLIPNGIDTEVFKPSPSIQRKPFQLITTASADQPLKGLVFLLKAISLLVNKYPNLELLVIGKLKSGGQTEKLLKEENLQHRVRFMSGISTQALVNQYAEATIAISPSQYEGFGLPAGEAMACGCPVISSNGGALPEVVGDAGVIVPASSSTELTNAIDKLLQDNTLRETLSNKGRQRILDNFCWNIAATKLTRFYESILECNNNTTLEPCKLSISNN